MTDEIVSNGDEVSKALAIFMEKLQSASEFATKQIGYAVQVQAVHNASTGKHAPGKPHIKGTGPGPNRATSTLVGSFRMTERKGFGDYTIDVYPTAMYSRAVEFGNPRWKSGVKYPYLAPAGESVRRQAVRIFKLNLARRLNNG